MRKENEKMQEFLRKNGIEARAKYLWKGSCKKSWRLSNHKIEWWGNKELQDKLNELGFTDLWGKKLSDYSGNGAFEVFVRYKNDSEFIEN